MMSLTSNTASTTTVTDQAVISSFNRGSLVSVFVPPASCLSTLTSSNDLYFGHHGNGNYYDPACYPTSLSASQVPLNEHNPWDLYYYSPGQCPSGWSHATTVKSYFPGAHSYALALSTETTAVICCPTGYIYPTDTGLGHQCESTVLPGGTLTYVAPTPSQKTLALGNELTTAISTGGTPFVVYGDGIPVWFQSSDQAAFSATTSPSSLPATTPTTAMTATTTGTNTPSPPPADPGSGGLSTGAKVAIGVCIPLAVIAVLGGLFYYFRFRRRRGGEARHRGAPKGGPVGGGDKTPDVPLGDMPELANERPKVELGANENERPRGGVGIHELPSTAYT